MDNWSEEIQQGTRVTTDHSQEGETRFHIDIDDGRSMVVIVTTEGIIMDVFAVSEHIDYSDNPPGEDEHLGTAGMMFDEWADWVVDADRAEILTTVASHATWENKKPVFT